MAKPRQFLRAAQATAGATVPSGANAGAGDAQFIRVVTTGPESVLRHNISNEQLDMLAELRRDGVYEVAWAAAGLAFGAVPGAVEAVVKAYVTRSEPLPLVGLINVALLLVGMAAAGVAFSVSSGRRKKAKPLVEIIKSQPVK